MAESPEQLSQVKAVRMTVFAKQAGWLLTPVPVHRGGRNPLLGCRVLAQACLQALATAPVVPWPLVTGDLACVLWAFEYPFFVFSLTIHMVKEKKCFVSVGKDWLLGLVLGRITIHRGKASKAPRFFQFLDLKKLPSRSLCALCSLQHFHSLSLPPSLFFGAGD